MEEIKNLLKYHLKKGKEAFDLSQVKKISENEIDAIEKKLKYKFQNDLRYFISEYSGIKILNYAFVSVNKEDEFNIFTTIIGLENYIPLFKNDNGELIILDRKGGGDISYCYPKEEIHDKEIIDLESEIDDESDIQFSGFNKFSEFLEDLIKFELENALFNKRRYNIKNKINILGIILFPLFGLGILIIRAFNYFNINNIYIFAYEKFLDKYGQFFGWTMMGLGILLMILSEIIEYIMKKLVNVNYLYFFRVGKYYGNSGNIEQSIKIFKQLKKESFHNRILNYEIGRNYFEIKQYKKAIKYFKKSKRKELVDFIPKKWRTYRKEVNPDIWIAKCYIELNDYKTAIKYYNNVLFKDRQVDKFFIYNDIGHCYFYQEDYSEALLYYIKAHEIDKKNMGTIYNIVDSLGFLGRFKEAAEMAEFGLEIDPEYEPLIELKRQAYEYYRGY